MVFESSAQRLALLQSVSAVILSARSSVVLYQQPIKRNVRQIYLSHHQD